AYCQADCPERGREDWSFLARTIVAPLFKDCMSRKVNFPIFADESAGPYEYGCVVDNSLDSTLLGHSEHDVQPMFSRNLLDLLDAGSGNWLSEVVHFILHSIAG